MKSPHGDSLLTGTFTVAPDREVHGTLLLDGLKTSLHVWDSNPFSITPSSGKTITGILNDLTKVSLIECITPGAPGTSWRQDVENHFYDIPAYYVTFGDYHVNDTDSNVSQILFSLDDSTTLFQGIDTFGTLRCSSGTLRKVLDSEKPRNKISVCDHPLIAYYTGEKEIFSSTTNIGKIFAGHSLNVGFGGPDGAHLKNKIFIGIKFEEAITTELALSRMRQTLRFFSLMVGTTQYPTEIKIVWGANSPPKVVDVYASMYPEPKEPVEDDPTIRDTLINAAHDPDEFARVLKTWLERDAAWSNARLSFSSGWENNNVFVEDRMIRSANTFDFLPDSEFPDSETISENLVLATEEAKKIFRKLPECMDRNSVLSALGRVGKLTLKRKIHHRSQVLIEVIEDWIPDILVVVDEAVDCRNFFVHGGEAKINYEAEMATVVFLTNTLEFIFAASDLVDAGWDIRDWRRSGRGSFHPFGYYLINYAGNLQSLKVLLESANASAMQANNGRT